MTNQEMYNKLQIFQTKSEALSFVKLNLDTIKKVKDFAKEFNLSIFGKNKLELQNSLVQAVIGYKLDFNIILNI